MSRLEEQDAADLRTLLGTHQGSRFLSRLINETETFTPTSPRMSAMEMAFTEGVRSVGLLIVSQLDAIDAGWYSIIDSASKQRIRMEREDERLNNEQNR